VSSRATTSALARTLNLVQISIERQAAIPEFVTIAGIESRLERAMFAEWSELARDAITRVIRDAPDPLTQEYLHEVPGMLINGFRGWPSRDLMTQARESVEQVYKLSAQVIARKASGAVGYKGRDLRLKAENEVAATEVIPTFDTADTDAMNWLARSQVFWMGQHFDLDTVGAIRQTAWLDLVGRSGAEVGKVLKAEAEDIFGVGAFADKGRAYFEGVAVNAATTARVSGSVLQMRGLAITHYVFMAVLDERTTEICQHMDGKTFSVSEAADRIDQMVQSGDPNAVKSMHGWDPGGFLDKLTAQGVDLKPDVPLSAEHASIVMRQGFAFPPLHFRCRSTVDIGYSTDEPPPDAIPDPNAFPWKPEDLKIVGDAGQGLGGVNAKVVLEAPDGSRWLFKPYTHRGDQDEYRAYADKLAADVAKALDHPTTDVYLLTLPKGHEGLKAMSRVGDRKAATGSIQRMLDNVEGVIGTTSWKDLTPEQLLHVQKEHLLDWLISNHDGHLENILKRSDGTLLGIDKGQAFKFFGRDRLHWTYSPNAGGGFHAPYFNEQAEKYAIGEMGRRFLLKGPQDNPELMAFLEKIRDMDDDAFLAMFRPYASKATAAGIRWAGMGEDQFLQALLDRKRTIVDDATKFYKDLNAERKKALPPIPRKPKTPPAVTPLTDEFVKDLDAAGWEGKALLLSDMDRIRSGQVLVYGMDGDGSVLETYLTEDGESALLTALGASIPSTTARVITTGSPDTFYDPSLKAVKSLVAHLGDPAHSVYDGKITDQTWQALKTMKATKALESSMTDVEKAQFGHYYQQVSDLIGGWHHVNTTDATPPVSALQAITNSVQAKKSAGFAFGKYAPTATPPVTAPGRFQVTAIKAAEWDAKLLNGRIQYQGTIGKTYGPGGDTAWKIGIGGTNPPLTAIYVPYSGNLRSKQGRLRIMIEGQPARTITKEQISAGLDALKEFGIRSELAQPIDVEAEYLRKMTKLAKLHEDMTFNVPRGLPSSEVVDKLGQNWSTKLGVKDVRRTKLYDPTPEFSPGDRGWARWKRFDIGAKQVEGFVLDHQLYVDPVAFFNITAPSARGLVATETKTRIGIPIGGLSPEADMGTGGAQGVFMRLFEESTNPLQAGHIRIDIARFLDMDNYIFDEDRYGENTPTAFRNWHETDVSKANLRRIANRSGNETITPFAVTYDLFREVAVGSASQRDQILDILRTNGITHFGPVRIEDAVKVR
jgi:hypothetical protein